MSKQQYHVYGLGNALLDIEYDATAELLTELGVQKGVMTLIDEARHLEILARLKNVARRKVASGGSAANTMIALQQFGGKGFYTCKIANDETGNFYYQDMRAAGLASNLDTQTRPSGHTGKCIAFVTPDSDRTMQSFLGITETLSVDEVNESALLASDYLYIEGYLVTSPTARAAVARAQTLAHQHGIKVSLTLSDPAIAQYFKPQFEEILNRGVDLLFCNHEEALIYTGCKTVAEAAQALRKTVKQFAMTLGPQGSLLWDGTRLIEVSPHPVKAIDTLGAGDMYAGAFLYGITQGWSWENAGALASRASARIVTQYGPRLNKDEAQALLIRQLTETVT